MKKYPTFCVAAISLALVSTLAAQPAQIVVNANQPINSVSPFLGTGACIEDVNHEVYGGIYSQMIYGESFQEPSFLIQGFQNYGTGTISVQGSEVTLAPNSGSNDDKLIWNGATLSKGTVAVQVLRPGNNPGIAGFILDVQKAGQGIDQFYGYEITLNGTQLVLGRHRNNFEPIADFPCVTPTDQWVSIVVELNNDVLQISVNGNLIATYQDQEHPLAPGSIGLRSFGGQASFRNLSYTINGATTQVPFVAAGSNDAVSEMWTPSHQGTASGTYGLDTVDPFLGSQSQNLALASGTGSVALSNSGLNGWGMNFIRTNPDNGLVWVKGSKGTVFYVAAESHDGSAVYGEQRLKLPGTGWQKLKFSITPNANDAHGRFTIRLKSSGSITIGYAFLQPGNWGLYKGLPVRKDIVDGLLNQGVSFLRYGGSMVNAAQYRWKNMIGPRDLRQPYDGTWYPYSSNGWGIIDFLNLAEATGIQGVPALNSFESPQDMADFVQYVNGPATSKWGRERAADGHPAPYRLKYFEFGNEERVDDNYWQRFEAMAKAVWAADPNIIIIVGDFNYGRPITDPFNFSGAASGITSLEAHQKILQLAKANNREVWFDVHIATDGPGADPTLTVLPTYVSAIDQVADGAPHHVVVFELNANNHTQARAVGNALAINQISRIADPLPMVSSANCLQPDGENDNGWDQGLLFFNPSQVWLQPPGYCTQMLANNFGNQLLAVQTQDSNDPLDVTAKRSPDGATLIVQVVNPTGGSVSSTVTIRGFRAIKTVSATELAAPLDATNTAEQPLSVVPVSRTNSSPDGKSTNYTFQPYSVTMLKFH